MSEGKYWKEEILCSRAGLENGNIWVTKDEEYIHIEDLSDEHLINIVKMLKGSGKEKVIQYDRLIEELKNRKLEE